MHWHAPLVDLAGLVLVFSNHRCTPDEILLQAYSVRISARETWPNPPKKISGGHGWEIGGLFLESHKEVGFSYRTFTGLPLSPPLILHTTTDGLWI